VFGLDGVLTQTGKVHGEAWKQLLDYYLERRAKASESPFIPFDAASEYSVHFQGRIPLDAVRSFLDARGIELPEATMLALIERKEEILAGLLQHERVETYEGSLRYLRAARAAGLRTAVVSSSTHCDDILRAAGVADLFDARIDGAVATAQYLRGRPAPDTYLAAADAVGAEAEEVAVFEDELNGIDAGRSGHFGYIVGVDRLGHAAELRRHGADVVVTDLAALLAA
jgi:HAD superfamily hydrolase (TIGR01509 family)